MAKGPDPFKSQSTTVKGVHLLSTGTTRTEKFLVALARQSFFSRWSFSNLYRDEGKKNGGDGKELIDLLVVFNGIIILFEDKESQFPFEKINSKDAVKIHWSRWYKSTILKATRQLKGAENWIKNHPTRIFLDQKCETPFPLSFEEMRDYEFFRVSTVHGLKSAASYIPEFSKIGSLILDNDVNDKSVFNTPFKIGQTRNKNGFVHVFNDGFIELLLNELDTISDFTEYLRNREKVISDLRNNVVSFGEENMLPFYLTSDNRSTGHHYYPASLFDGSNICGNDIWASYISSAQYKRKKLADKKSYEWDSIIEDTYSDKFNEKLVDRKLKNIVQGDYQSEPHIRLMAAENRLTRRALADAYLDVSGVSRERVSTRVVESTSNTYLKYLFIFFPGYAYSDLGEKVKIAEQYYVTFQLADPERSEFIAICRDNPGYNNHKLMVMYRPNDFPDTPEVLNSRKQAKKMLSSPEMRRGSLRRSYAEFPGNNKENSGNRKERKMRERLAIRSQKTRSRQKK